MLKPLLLIGVLALMMVTGANAQQETPQPETVAKPEETSAKPEETSKPDTKKKEKKKEKKYDVGVLKFGKTNEANLKDFGIITNDFDTDIEEMILDETNYVPIFVYIIDST
jgi:hypothetical protein